MRISEQFHRVKATMREDFAESWAVTARPESLGELRARRVPGLEAVIGGSEVLRLAQAVWMTAVAIPVSAVAYTAAWVFQSFVRFAVAVPVVAAVALLWRAVL